MTATAWPTSVDVFSTKTDGVDRVLADHVNFLQSAVVAMENATIGQSPAKLALLFDNTNSSLQALYSAGIKTGLAPGNSQGPIKLEASQQQWLNDVLHDYNIGLAIQQWTASGAGITIGDWGQGDGIYVQTTDTAATVAASPPNAINVFAGTSPQQPTDSGSGGAVTYGATTLTDTGKAWTVNQWVNRYVIVGTTRMLVTSNTATVLTGTGGWTQNNGALPQQIAAATPANGSAYTIPNANGTGINIQRFGTGNALRVIGQAGSGAGTGALILMTQAAGVNAQSISITNDSGSTTANTIEVTATAKTSGNVIQLFHAGSAMSGAGMLLNFAVGSGTFTGYYARFQLNNVDKFLVNAAGTVLVAAGQGLDTAAAGALNLGLTNATTITIGAAAKQLQLTAATGAVVIQAGGLSVTGGITLTDAVSQLIPGATSFAIRDTGNANNNLLVSNAGAVTVRAGLTVSASGVTVTGASSIAGQLTISGANNIVFSTSGQGLSNSGGNLYLNAAAGNTVLFEVNNAVVAWANGNGIEIVPGEHYDTTGAGALNIGNSNATSIVIGVAGFAVSFPGGLTVAASKSIDTTAAGALSIGPTNANALNLGNATSLVNFAYATVALGGGAAPTFGTIGGSGPAAAAQNSWLKVNVNGTASFLPLWR